jgi:hypothetical protein
MLPAPLVKVKQRRAFRLRVRLFKKRPYYVVLGLDFPSLGAQRGAKLLEIGVGFLAHVDGRSVFAFNRKILVED